MISLLILLFTIPGVFGFLDVDDTDYIIIDDKQYLSKTIHSTMAKLSNEKTIHELSEIKFHLYEDELNNYPGKSMFGYPVNIMFEFSDGFTKKVPIQTKMLGHKNNEGLPYDIVFYSRENWPEVGVITGLNSSYIFTKLLVFEKYVCSNYHHVLVERPNGKLACVYETTAEKLGWVIQNETQILTEIENELKEKYALDDDFESVMADSAMLSPLKQFKLGIPIDEIQCKESLTLITKHYGSPACVKPETKENLVERGWTTTSSDTHR